MVGRRHANRCYISPRRHNERVAPSIMDTKRKSRLINDGVYSMERSDIVSEVARHFGEIMTRKGIRSCTCVRSISGQLLKETQNVLIEKREKGRKKQSRKTRLK